MKYEVFVLLQEYQKKHPEKFLDVKPQDLKKICFELKTWNTVTKEVERDAHTVSCDHYSCNRGGNVY